MVAFLQVLFLYGIRPPVYQPGGFLRLALLGVGSTGEREDGVQKSRNLPVADLQNTVVVATRRDVKKLPTNNHDLWVVKSFGGHRASGRPAWSIVWRVPSRRLSLSLPPSRGAHTRSFRQERATATTMRLPFDRPSPTCLVSPATNITACRETCQNPLARTRIEHEGATKTPRACKPTHTASILALRTVTSTIRSRNSCRDARKNLTRRPPMIRTRSPAG